MDFLFGISFMLIGILLYIMRDAYNMPCRKAPIGYLDDKLIFHPKDIHYKNEYYYTIRTPKMLCLNKKSSMFWIDINYCETVSFDETYTPLKISKDAYSYLSLSPSSIYISTKKYMLFSFNPPLIDDIEQFMFYIIKSDSGLLLTTNHEPHPIEGTVVAFSLSNEVYSADHLYTLGRLIRGE